MGSVYRSLSKKKKNQAEEDDFDIEMEEERLDDESDTESDDSEDDEESIEGSDSGAENGVTKSISTQSQKSTFMPKTRVLMLTSRGVSYRQRHLLTDLAALLPHTHKESKLDTKKSAGYNSLLNSLAELNSCNVIFFLEARKNGQDLYLWLARPPNGPTIKFAVTNLHTMGELGTGFSGNCLKGGRGVVVFDPSFDDQAIFRNGNEWRGLVKEMLRNVFCVSKRGVRGMKPFVDRIVGIFGVDGKIWIRVFEIRETEGTVEEDKDDKDGEAAGKKKKSKRSKDAAPEVSLVEIGPRFVLTPIVILEGSFGGPVIYENREYVSPNQVRREIRMKKASRYTTRRTEQIDRTVKKSGLGLSTESAKDKKKDELDSRVLFA